MPTCETKQTEDQQFPSPNTVWCPEKCWWEGEFSPLIPSFPLWRSWAHTFLVWLIAMNEATCSALWAGPPRRWGSCPCHPAGHSQGDWWPCLLKCVWGSSSWSCPGLCRSLPLTGRASAALLIERLRLARLCDTSPLMWTDPETRFPPATSSPCAAVCRR